MLHAKTIIHDGEMMKPKHAKGTVILALILAAFLIGVVLGVNIGIARGQPYTAHKTCVINQHDVELHTFDCTVTDNLAYME
jgi:hypothetical protein